MISSQQTTTSGMPSHDDDAEHPLGEGRHRLGGLVAGAEAVVVAAAVVIAPALMGRHRSIHCKRRTAARK